MTDETSRLAALADTQLLDTPAEPAFDQVARLAARLFDVPIALVSLIDAERQWFKACIGLDAAETPREHAFCAHTIQQDGIMVVPDARADPRFADNPLVTGEPHIRFYAGAPVRAATGEKLGTLCLIDDTPRAPLSEAELSLLRDLAKLAEEQIRVRSTAVSAPAPATPAADQLVQAAPDALIQVDATGEVVAWNAAAERLFGWSAATLRGMPLPFLDGVAGDAWCALHRRAGSGETVHGWRSHADARDGTVHPVRVDAAPGSDAGGAVFTVAPDPEATAEVPAAPGGGSTVGEARALNAFVEMTRDGVITADLSGRITSWNPGAAQMFGRSADDAVGRRLSDLMPVRYRAAHEAGMARVAREHRSRLAGQQLEMTALHSDGTEFPIELAVTSWLEDGEMKFGAVVRDISPRRQAEQERRAVMESLHAEKERAEAASHAKSRFLANVSHELRTPLNAVIGFAEILADPQLRSVASQQYETYGQDILDSGRYLLSVIDTLMDLSRAEAGLASVEPGAVEVAPVVQRVARMMRERARLANQDLRVEVADTVPPAHADETALRRILLNLATNAVQFTGEGGAITLRAAGGDGVTITVADTGPGMDPAEIPRALEPFGQPGHPFNAPTDGTGLGLPLAKQLAETMGGTLTIDSTPGEGTCVRVSLPAAVSTGANAA